MTLSKDDTLEMIRDWLDSVTDPLQADADKCHRFQLVHYVDRNGIKEQDQLAPFSFCASIADLAGLSEERRIQKITRAQRFFYQMAQTVAEEHKRAQQFRIHGFRDDDLGAPASNQCIFSVVRTGGADKYAEAIEGTDEAGQRALVGRHAEQLLENNIELLKAKNRATEMALDAMGPLIANLSTETQTMRGEMRTLFVQSQQEMRALFTQLQDEADRKVTRVAAANKAELRLGVEKAGYETLFQFILPMVLDKYGMGPAANVFRDVIQNPEANLALRAILPTLPERTRTFVNDAMNAYAPERFPSVEFKRENGAANGSG